MHSSTIDFSAQFGGRDAAAAVLPHFNALKAASRGIRLNGFPYPTLAFILRVDGDVNQYHLSGPGNIDIDGNEKYLSVDIGITRDDRDHAFDVISHALITSPDKIMLFLAQQLLKVDIDALRACLLEVVANYRNTLPQQRADS